MKYSTLLILVLALTVFSSTLLVGCAPAATTRPDALQSITPSPTEVIGTDVIASTATSSAITVAGVKLGMTPSQVQTLLGSPDDTQDYDFGAIQNMLYGKKIGLTDTGFIVHVESGFVTRISIFAPLNEKLVGE